MQNHTPAYNIVLIGFMACGKSTTARELARILHMQVVEMDEEIERREGMSIPDLFARYGEEYFRDLETQLLIDLQSRTGCIISCGGGVPLRERNAAEMRKNGRIFCLTASPATVLRRTGNDTNRPLLANRRTPEAIEELMDARKERYLACADYCISTDGRTVREVCEEILSCLRA